MALPRRGAAARGRITAARRTASAQAASETASTERTAADPPLSLPGRPSTFTAIAAYQPGYFFHGSGYFVANRVASKATPKNERIGRGWVAVYPRGWIPAHVRAG